MWSKWLPWRILISRAAKSQGFIDPIGVLSRLHRLAQPSEVTEPIELLRAGMVLHARGLINTGTIQHNLDWVWPYWVERQFNPNDPSFIPRAFSITHVNLTHRNWTAVGIPDCASMPIIDPRGLVTPLLDGWSLDGSAARKPSSNWTNELEGACQIKCPNEQWNKLFRDAVSSMILHSPGDVFPGPYTYKRFWFRDAAFILSGLLAANLSHRVARVVDRFPDRQDRRGYFRSQEGEWDSNGEAIWIIDQYHRCTDIEPTQRLIDSVIRGGRWIVNKRLDDSLSDFHAGLMPAGFSAEHLGHSDFYYWDDFWSLIGLQRAARMAETAGLREDAELFRIEAAKLQEAIDRSLRVTDFKRGGAVCIPAAPDRRMDAGAIGSLAASYPLQAWENNDHRMMGTIDFLLENCMVNGGFFQDMIHSGINPYLTLHLAQVLLRSGTDSDQRYLQLTQAVADLASPTGQWPEAVHPITVRIRSTGDQVHVNWNADWHRDPPAIQISLPGTETQLVSVGECDCQVELNVVGEATSP